MSKEFGSQFVYAIAEKKLEVIQKLFSDNIIFTAATPDGTLHGIGWPQTEMVLREFFPLEEKITEVRKVNHFTLPGRSRISYIFSGHEDNDELFEYEHQAYYQIDAGKISHMRILCSGLYKPQK